MVSTNRGKSWKRLESPPRGRKDLVATNKPKLRKRATIKIAGKLTPAEGGERVVVAGRTNGRWGSRVVTVASNGTFTTSWKIKRTTHFVAKWAGDDDRAGDGSADAAVAVDRDAGVVARAHARLDALRTAGQ